MSLRTQESVILDDASAQNPFSADPYIRQHQARSILCLPLINQAKLIGVLYLENNLTARVFTPARIAVLKLLASQAAISLENTRLYRDLAEREAKIRRLVDANIIGIFIWDLEGRIIEANDAFLRMVGYDREDLVSGRLRWTDLTPPNGATATHGRGGAEDDRNRAAVRERVLPEGRQPRARADRRRPRSTSDETRASPSCSILTERKRAEAEARESERRYREVQMELAHANRVATMGQLTASIAHEVNQPIAASGHQRPGGAALAGASTAGSGRGAAGARSIVKDGNRAGDVIGRIRDLVKKAPPRKDRLDINEAIREVIELTRGEAVKNGVSVQTELAEGLPLIEGDRVQLQQVVLNLIINAVEAMGASSDGPRELLVSTGKAESDGVLVAVRDSGPGLAPGDLEHLFEAFYTTKPDGLGWGCRSAARSSKRTGAACGRARTCPAAPLSVHGACPPRSAHPDACSQMNACPRRARVDKWRTSVPGQKRNFGVTRARLS